MNLVAFLFWLSAGVLIYVFVGFPLILILRGLLLPRPYKQDDITPSVSLIIAAYNEAGVIEEKLKNTLSLDYPPDRLEIIVASDGSTDGTDEIVKRYAERGVRLLALPRGGKIPALNTASSQAKGEILVFSDANSMYAPDALRALVRPFADPKVGGVAGNQCYLPADKQSLGGIGEQLYWNFDQYLKEIASRAGNAISATGSMYAIRRSLFEPIPTGVTDDFMISTNVIKKGYRLVYALDARTYEPVSSDTGMEFKRKVRVITQGLQAVMLHRQLLNPFRYGFYAVQLFSHKLLRRLMAIPLIVLFVTSLLLVSISLFYEIAALAQSAFYGLALIGIVIERVGPAYPRPLKPLFRMLSIPYFFCAVYISSLVAVLNLLRGNRIELWEPQRADPKVGDT